AGLPGLKSIDDATMIRRRVLTAFERAEMVKDPVERERLLRFVIVGGGPTGVELAGAISELAHFALARDFRTVDPRSTQIVLAEAGPRVLPAFAESSSSYAQAALERLGVEVRVSAPVTDLAGDRIMIRSGPTGVELAGAISELAHFALARDFRTVDPRSTQIVLAEAGPRVLPAFAESSSSYAQAALERLGVEVRVSAPVTDLEGDRIMI